MVNCFLFRFFIDPFQLKATKLKIKYFLQNCSKSIKSLVVGFFLIHKTVLPCLTCLSICILPNPYIIEYQDRFEIFHYQGKDLPHFFMQFTIVFF